MKIYSRTTGALAVLVLLIACCASPAASAAGTAGLTIVSSPGGATVTIDGSYVGTTSAGSTAPLAVTVNAGTHAIAVSKMGYQPSVTTLQVKAGEAQTVSITLAPSPPSGTVSVASTPGSASVTLDGGSAQTTPETYSNVEPGTHSVKVTKPGFVPWSKTVTVEAGKTVQVNAILTAAPDVGTLSVTSSPSGADIYLDGTYWGHTPMTLGNVVQGGHEIRLLCAGYQAWTQTTSITGGQTTQVTAVLVPMVAGTTGDIAVSSSPAGAAIYLDGAFRGTTAAGNPIDITGVPAGTHTITLKLAGYADYVTGVQVGAGQTATVSATLTPMQGSGSTGSVSITSSPSGADIYLDNQYLGITPLTHSGVAPGSHEVRLALVGYQDWSNQVQVTAGQTTQVTAGMAGTPSPQQSGSLPVLLPCALGLAAVLGLLGRAKKE
ncbi:PEGA domain-containing protein [Methanoculleus sp. FWC-SCC1]|uniref:PEGA domain-containing protein n=1 Tax=Methanoculleus frigidifontis TaxID=2584085 RepID=A0ABT8MCD2_9EURY|nr:PEGA domain-containing protein [Methanoculleus sp. FWC-SCC1]MDN7025535.1 PEGA domain-containing protein [Methanoculleus sp. FWC-SCC1]